MKPILLGSMLCLLCSCSVRNHPESQPMLSFGAARSVRLPEQFELLSWNVYKGRRLNFSCEFRRLADTAEILTLQEASTRATKGMQNIQQVMPVGRVCHLAGVLQYRDGQAGVATASITRPLRVMSLPSTDGEPLMNLRKSSVITTYRLTNSTQTLMVANTHGLNLAGKLWFGQASFERQVHEVAEVLSRHDGPIIWAGDFNTHDEAKTKALYQETNRLGLHRLPVRLAVRLMHSKAAGLEIDQVYVRGLKASAEAVEHHESSDHTPIVAQLSLK